MNRYLQIWQRYVDLLKEDALTIGALFLGGMVIYVASLLLDRKRTARQRQLIGGLLLFIAAGSGLYLLAQNASLFDDAFISFRYSRNLVEGNGLVFNLGERVEGYTNFLWTLLIAAFMWLSPFDAPEIALVGCVLCYLANLLVVHRLSTTLRPLGDHLNNTLPLAVALLAVQGTFVSFGTTGMETGFACLLVMLGVLKLIRASKPCDVSLASLYFILATLTRPDHAIFYIAGSLVVAGTWGMPALRAARVSLREVAVEGGRHLVAWVTPFSLYIASAIWRYSYYGQLLPNTYYAKSADKAYFSQGWIYAESFYLGSHMWLVALLFLLGLAFSAKSSAQRRFRWIALISVMVYNFYVLKVGGGFMYGRFYLTLIPLLLLGAEMAVRWLLSRNSPARLVAGCVAAGLLSSTAFGVQMMPPRKMSWHLVDEASYYPLTSWFPAVVNHGNFRIGTELGRVHAAGLNPLVATSGVGMLGYRSRLPILDRVGLVDEVVAHSELKKRGRPGHEKFASKEYVSQRNPHFVRGGRYIPKSYEKLTRIRFGNSASRRKWLIYHYDRKMMLELREVLPKAKFRDFEKYLDSYLRKARKKIPKRFSRDYRFFRRYYFQHNDDKKRLARFEKLKLRAKKRKDSR